ncbi:hypothetical protein E2C01_010314 [Portunus trituberculatus]|uniref:Uncharacterized protein n=1 Tax=Portunus trituberculatus TaxID=210409 RepID=A0A5B7D8A5_PORTR|nr:hypothetical protein [Portunus trituberculatus]
MTTTTTAAAATTSSTHLCIWSTGWFMILALITSAGQPRIAETRPERALQDGATLSHCLMPPYSHARPGTRIYIGTPG